MKIYSYAYLLHVNSMPGYFEDQDTSQAMGKRQTLHHSKRQRNNDQYYQEYDGQTQVKKNYQEIDKTSNIMLLCKIK